MAMKTRESARESCVAGCDTGREKKMREKLYRKRERERERVFREASLAFLSTHFSFPLSLSLSPLYLSFVLSQKRDQEQHGTKLISSANLKKGASALLGTRFPMMLPNYPRLVQKVFFLYLFKNNFFISTISITPNQTGILFESFFFNTSWVIL